MVTLPRWASHHNAARLGHHCRICRKRYRRSRHAGVIYATMARRGSRVHLQDWHSRERHRKCPGLRRCAACAAQHASISAKVACHGLLSRRDTSYRSRISALEIRGKAVSHSVNGEICELGCPWRCYGCAYGATGQRYPLCGCPLYWRSGGRGGASGGPRIAPCHPVRRHVAIDLVGSPAILPQAPILHRRRIVSCAAKYRRVLHTRQCSSRIVSHGNIISAGRGDSRRADSKSLLRCGGAG
jgi:hypothetical protein